jgi:hypothetical protein
MLAQDVAKQIKATIIKIILVKVPITLKNLALSTICGDILPISPYFKSF